MDESHATFRLLMRTDELPTAVFRGLLRDLECAYNRFFREIVVNELASLPERIVDRVVLAENVAESCEVIEKVVYSALTKLAGTEFDEEGLC